MEVQVPSRNRSQLQMLIGNNPIMLQALSTIKSPNPKSGILLTSESDRWDYILSYLLDSSPVLSIRAQIGEFYASTKAQYEDKNSSWKK